MNIDIDTKSIQDSIVRAIADSAIGDQVKHVIQTQLTAKDKIWDSETIMQSAIKGEVNRIIGIIIREEIENRKEEIRALVAPQLTEEIISQMGRAAFDVMLGRLSAG